MRTISVLLVLVSLGAAPAKDQIAAAKKDAIAYLLSVQQQGRGWEPPTYGRREFENQVTIKVLYALADAGIDLSNNTPAHAAVSKLADAELSSNAIIAMRVRLLGNPIFKNQFKRQIAADIRVLRASTKTGVYSIPVGTPKSYWSMMCTYHAWFALHEQKEKVSESAWIKMADSLIDSQSHAPKPQKLPGYPDGWTTNGTWDESWQGRASQYGDLTATAYGALLLMLAKDNIKEKGEKARIDASVNDAIAYIDRGIARDMKYDRPSALTAPEAVIALKILGKAINRHILGGQSIEDFGANLAVSHISKESLPSMSPASIAEYLQILSN